jgi:hypothetical protein
MTTTVTVLIQGNKACEVSVSSPSRNDLVGALASTVSPGEFVTKTIHDDMMITVKETGEFL